MKRFCVAVAGVLVLSLARLAAAPAADTTAVPKNLLLIGQQPDGHARTEHEYMAGMRILNECLQGVGGLKTQVVYGREPWAAGPQLLRDCDGVMLFVSQGARWMQAAPRRYEALAELASRGGGIGAIHWAIGAKDGKYREGQKKLLGASRGGRHRPFGHFTARLTPAASGAAILKGVKPLTIRDEFYYQLEFIESADSVQPLITARIEDKDEVVAWSWQRPDGGRSFGFTGLHYHRNWESADYRRLVANAAIWIVGLPVPERGLAVDIAPGRLRLRDEDRQPPAATR